MTKDEAHAFVYCGNDCTRCPRYVDGSCGGCRTDAVAGDCLSCEPRSCCRSRSLADCGHCDDFPCAKVEAMYEKWTKNGFGAGAIACRQRLVDARNGLSGG